MIVPINEASWGRLYQHINNGDAIGFITAFRGNLSRAENRRRNNQLESMIRALHFGFNKIEGHYVEDENGDVSEETFVVYAPAERREELRKLLQEAMEAYDQDSCIFITANETDRGPKSETLLIFRDGRETDLGDFRLTPTNMGSIYSKIKHTAFRFGDIVEGCQYRTKSLGQGDCYSYLTARRLLRESNGDFCRRYIRKFNIGR